MGYLVFLIYVVCLGEGSFSCGVQWFVMNNKNETWLVELKREIGKI
jgi:hypothetical protein